MTYMLFIKVDRTLGQVVIEDGAGRVGGDLRLRVGDWVCWINATGQDCHLMFRGLKLARSAPRYTARVWPFEGHDPNPGGDLNIPASGWCGRVRAPDEPRGPTADYIKYDVKVTGGGPPLDLDPVIIIDR